MWTFAKRLEQGRFTWAGGSSGAKLALQPAALAQALDEVRLLQTELAAVRAQLAWLKQNSSAADRARSGSGATAFALLQIEALEKLAALPPA